MTWQRRLVLFIISALLIQPCITLASVRDLQEDIDLITSRLSSDAGIKVVSLNKKQVLFSKNETMPLNPASVTKLVTAAAALKYLGPDFRFRTKFLLTPQNDLYIYGEGDPSIVTEEIRTIAKELAREIRNIRHIVVNDSYFGNYRSPGLSGNKDHYNSYTGALSLNYNRMIISVTPAKKVGALCGIKAGGEDFTIDVKNEVVASNRRGGTYVNLKPPMKGNEDIFTVTGHVPAASRAKMFEARVSLPPLYFALALKSLLQQNGCKVTGSIYGASNMKDARPILDHRSKPLSEILADMNKFSNNFIAEQLVKFLGAKFVGIPGNTEKGVDVLKKYLSGLGMQQKDYQIVNGSGLTYDNRMSAELFVRLIQDMYDDHKLWPAFEGSLSIAGRDGTLRHRCRSGTLYGRLMAKTGTVNGVKAIAGVVPSDDNETIAFAILLNGHPNTSGAKDVQTKIAEAIAKFRR